MQVHGAAHGERVLRSLGRPRRDVAPQLVQDPEVGLPVERCAADRHKLLHCSGRYSHPHHLAWLCVSFSQGHELHPQGGGRKSRPTVSLMLMPSHVRFLFLCPGQTPRWQQLLRSKITPPVLIAIAASFMSLSRSSSARKQHGTEHPGLGSTGKLLVSAGHWPPSACTRPSPWPAECLRASPRARFPPAR